MPLEKEAHNTVKKPNINKKGKEKVKTDYYRFSIALSRDEETLWKEHQYEYNEKTLTGFVKLAVNKLILKQDINDAVNMVQRSENEQFQGIVDKSLEKFDKRIEQLEVQQISVLKSLESINNSIHARIDELS
ncbi:MAG: hypothetical protein ACXAEU_19195, partial [Candidatus Hodarchaeales archaeon]